MSVIRRPCLALAKAGRRPGPPLVWSFAFATLAAPTALPLRFGDCRLPPSKAPILRCSLRHPSSTYSFAYYAVSRLPPAPFKTSDPSQQPSNLRCRFLPLLAVAVTFDSPPQLPSTASCGRALSQGFAPTIFLAVPRPPLAPLEKLSTPPCSARWPFQPSVAFPAAELCPGFAQSLVFSSGFPRLQKPYRTPPCSPR